MTYNNTEIISSEISDKVAQEGLLRVIAEATRCLLSIADFDTAVNDALKAIATAARIDRIYIFQNHIQPRTEREFATCPYEWTQAGIVKCNELPGQFPVFYDEIDGYRDCLAELKAGRAVRKLARDISTDGQLTQIQEQALSVLTVPIFVDGNYWGNFGFDDCTVERQWSNAEIAVLKTAAACIGNAIEQDDERKKREATAQIRTTELEAHNQALANRDRVLEAIAKAANVLLTEAVLDDAINTALLIVGEAVQTDRVAIIKNIESLTDSSFGQWYLIYEWTSPLTSPVTQSDYPELMCGTYEGIEDIYQSHCRGEGFSRLIDELPEPFRSGQMKLGVQSMHSVPIMQEGCFWGAVTFDDCTDARRRRMAELAVLQTLADCIGNAIERDRIRKEREAAAQARTEELFQVNSILQTSLTNLASQTDLSAFLGHVTHLINQASGAFSGYVFLQDTSTNTLELRLSVKKGQVCVGASATDPELFQHPFPADITPAYPELCKTREIGLYSGYFDADSDLMWPGTTEWHRRSGHKEAAAVALFAGDRPLGMLGLTFNLEVNLSDEDRDLIRALADQAAVAIQLANLAEATKQTALLQERETVAKARIAELAERDRMLEATAAAANVMLTAERFDDAINRALRIVGEGLAVDRIGLMKYTEAISPQESGYHRMIYEWDSDGISAQIQHAELVEISDEGIESWIDSMKRGEIAGGVVDEMPDPFRSKQKELGVLSTYAVPIRINTQYWGMIGFDDCHKANRRSEAEIEVLMTLANCIGSAIVRDLNRKEREVAAKLREAELDTHNLELANRDRILEATAAAANVLLTDEDFEGAFSHALQIIGEAVGTDRVGIAQHLEDLTEHQPGHWRVIYEWHIDELTSVMQLSSPDPMQGSYAGAEVLYATHQRGEGFSITTNQMAEPFRSSMTFMNVQTLHAVPISLKNRYWGTVVFGDCRQQRQRSQAELSALQTVADCVGNAIDRDRIRKEREAAAQARAAELQRNNEILSLRDRWLGATAAAAEQLLSVDDLKSAIEPALQEIGASIGVDRIGIMYAFECDDQQVLGFFAEWIHPSQPVQSKDKKLAAIPCNLIGEQHLNALLGGQWYGGDIEDFPEPFCSSQKAIGVQSTYSVPIFIEGRFWGLVGIDHCREKELLTETEIAVFQTIASCFASAIQRDQIRQAREDTERTALIDRERAARATELEAANQVLMTRDRWLETTAIATSQLLATPDITANVNTALDTLGTNLESDRLGVMQYISSDQEFGYFQILYEWSSEGINRQIDDPNLHQMDANDFAEWTQQLMAGQAVGGPIEEQSEPFQEKMKQLSILSTYAVPILVDSHFWGLVFMDYCRDKRQLTPAEIAVFSSAANGIGSAISREQIERDRELTERNALIQQEREQAAQNRAEALEVYNQQLQQRDRLLNCVNAAAQCLVINENLEQALPTMLKILGEGTTQCRAYILQNFHDPKTDKLHFDLTYEWDAPYIPPKRAVGARFPVPIDRFPEHLTAPLKAGRATQFFASELDGLNPEHRDPGQALSLVGVPIKIGDKWWGLLGLDDCLEERVWSEAEIAVLETAAAAVGGALERDRTRQAREAAEKAILEEREKAAQERASELAKTNEAIAKSLTSLAANPELDSFLGTIIAEMARQLNAGKVHLFLYDAQAHTLTQRVAVQNGQIYLGPGPNDPDMFSHPIPADITPGWNAIITAKRPLTYDETQPYEEGLWWPESIAWHKAQGHKAIICIPMKAGDVPIGYIGFCFYDRTFLSDEQIEFMQALSNQAIVAIQLTNLAEKAKQTAILEEQEKAARERASELAKTNEAIAQTLDVLTTTPELNEFLGQILTQIVDQIGADDTHLFLYNAEAHTLRSQLAVQNKTIYLGTAPGDPDIFDIDIPADTTKGWELIINSPKPYTLDRNNPKSADFMWPTTMEWHDFRGHQSATYTCMKIGNQPIGFIGFAFCDCKVLTNEQLEFIQALTNQATLAVHLTRLAEQAQNTALTDERNRLAREIHDTLAQAFTGVSLQLEAVRGLIHQPKDTVEALATAQTYIKRARDLARRGLSEARRSVQALRSEALETDDLPNALQKAVNQTQRDADIATNFHLEGAPFALNDEIQLNLLRIAQEAITNTLRHAHASVLQVMLRFEIQQVQLVITDDGHGFNTEELLNQSGFGIIGMRERTARLHGTFTLESHPDSGTTLTIIVPI